MNLERYKSELEFLKLQQRIRDTEIELERLEKLRFTWMHKFIDKRVKELEQMIKEKR
jgi:hypothetical protein